MGGLGEVSAVAQWGFRGSGGGVTNIMESPVQSEELEKSVAVSLGSVFFHVELGDEARRGDVLAVWNVVPLPSRIQHALDAVGELLPALLERGDVQVRRPGVVEPNKFPPLARASILC